MLALVGLLSPTDFGSQLYKTQPLLKAPGFNPVLPGKPIWTVWQSVWTPIMVHMFFLKKEILQADAILHKPTFYDGVFLTRHHLKVYISWTFNYLYYHDLFYYCVCAIQFQTLNLLLLDSVRRNPATVRATDEDVQKSLSEWLKHAKNRIEQQRLRHQRRST